MTIKKTWICAHVINTYLIATAITAQKSIRTITMWTTELCLRISIFKHISSTIGARPSSRVSMDGLD